MPRAIQRGKKTVRALDIALHCFVQPENEH